MAKKIAGLIEAVRYKNGHILQVRAYERRGATFSDLVLINRKTLLERVQKGAQYVTGSRKDLLASTFAIGKPVRIVTENNHEFITTYEKANRDELEGLPVF